MRERGNHIDWPAVEGTVRRCDAPTGIGERLKRAVHPLSSPLLPFRYWSRFRLGWYYRRLLSDRRLAERWAAHYLDRLTLPRGAAVLEHGCGRGRNMAILNQLGYRAVGQDIVAHDWWRYLPESGFQTLSPTESYAPWKTGSFDLVLTVGVIHYLSPDALKAHVEEMARVLKPGGYWITLEANDGSVGKRCFQFSRMHSIDAFKAVATPAGFRELSTSYEGFYAPVFPMAINYLRKECGPWPFDMTDYDSWLARLVAPEKRGLWLLRLQRIAA